MSEERRPFDVPPTEPESGPEATPSSPPSTPPAGVSQPPPLAERQQSAPPPPNIHTLPPRPARPAISTAEWLRRSEGWLSQLGIDSGMATRVTLIAIIAGVLGALLDEILGLPGMTLRTSFGGTLVAALSGLSYPYYKGREDLPGLIMAAFAGLVAFLVWYLVTEIVGDAFLNVPKAMVSGIFAGMIGFGWLALLHAIPKNAGWSR